MASAVKPPAPGEGALSLLFSLNKTFTQDLSDQTSAAFINLANSLTSVMDLGYRRFPSFRRSRVNSFRKGSVISDMTLVFDNETSVPSTNETLATFVNISTNLTVVPNSIKVGFKNLAATVVTEVNKAYSKRFSAFRRSLVRSFRSGSIVTLMTLVFDNNSSLPSWNETLGAANFINLPILSNSIFASGSALRPTVFSLVFLPVILALLMASK
ncbi:hypothetical protein DPEC_G00180460 [Dallia pectoralis]|uniref:Uncharacterized protein n=1 Tax=Dallia pectoralis TaxID=75939 RepID=A0ACC2GAA8_DALPE|nr:hypothetical protein DPEC_G00180460 [Dallia pectoralis]